MSPKKASWKDEWKTLYQTDGEWLRCKKNGTEPTLEVAQEIGTYEDEEGFEQHKFQLFRFDVERFKLVADPDDFKKVYLVPENYNSSWQHPLSSYEEWFAKDLESVARSAGVEPMTLAERFTSTDPKVRARAYMDVAGYHGLENFDSYPLELNEPELNERWG
jgi:hypothetical protein